MWLFGSSRFTKLNPTGISTALYTVYYASWGNYDFYNIYCNIHINFFIYNR
jgi:hypothetical protein